MDAALKQMWAGGNLFKHKSCHWKTRHQCDLAEEKTEAELCVEIFFFKSEFYPFLFLDWILAYKNGDGCNICPLQLGGWVRLYF